MKKKNRRGNRIKNSVGRQKTGKRKEKRIDEGAFGEKKGGGLATKKMGHGLIKLTPYSTGERKPGRQGKRRKRAGGRREKNNSGRDGLEKKKNSASSLTIF